MTPFRKEVCTGRQRYRISALGKCVLQVEVQHLYVPRPHGRLNEHTVWLSSGIEWRDARAEDITTAERRP